MQIARQTVSRARVGSMVLLYRWWMYAPLLCRCNALLIMPWSGMSWSVASEGSVAQVGESA